MISLGDERLVRHITHHALRGEQKHCVLRFAQLQWALRDLFRDLPSNRLPHRGGPAVHQERSESLGRARQRQQVARMQLDEDLWMCGAHQYQHIACEASR